MLRPGDVTGFAEQFRDVRVRNPDAEKSRAGSPAARASPT